DNGLAINAKLSNPKGINIDRFNNIYIADMYNNRIRKVDTNGIITTIAGNNYSVYSGDYGKATNAYLSSPRAIHIDKDNNFYILESHRIRKIDTKGIINTIAGNSSSGYTGDNGLAIISRLYNPSEMIIDNTGNIYISDSGNNRIRKIDVNGIITTIAGTGISGYSGDSGLAINAQFSYPSSIVMDNIGNIYITDINNMIRKISNPSIKP
ncbi:MAG: hypothetical protein AABZ74_03985, partial [Cyanobacteriota bacterium]